MLYKYLVTSVISAQLIVAHFSCAFSQNFDEAKVPQYTLPDPLTFENGSKVTSPKAWYTKRRPELLQLFESEMYGRSTKRPEKMSFEVFDNGPHSLKGQATRKQITLFLTGERSGPKIDVLLYLPNKVKKPVPVFLGLNFQGNHGVHTDSAIRLSPHWV